MGCYVLREGVLYWGGSMFVLLLFLAMAVTHTRPSVRSVTFDATLALIGGIAFGLSTWKINEWLFKRKKFGRRAP